MYSITTAMKTVGMRERKYWTNMIDYKLEKSMSATTHTQTFSMYRIQYRQSTTLNIYLGTNKPTYTSARINQITVRDRAKQRKTRETSTECREEKNRIEEK